MKKAVNFISAVIIAFLILPNIGCKKKEKAVAREKIINVKVEAAAKKKVRPFIESTGTLNPYESVTVSSEIDGRLDAVKVDAGTPVKKGMLLAKVDDKDLRLELEKAGAGMRQAEVTLSNTRLEYDRKKSLSEENLVTTQQVDDVSMRLSIAEAEVQSAKSSLSIAKQRLSKTKITSPISGVVEEKKVSQGDYVRNGTPLFSVIQPNPLRLQFSVPENEVGKLKPGQDVVFRVDALSGREFKAKLSIIYPSLEQNTRTLKVEALAANPDGLLKPGLFAKVLLYTAGEKEGIMVPVTALIYEADKIKVFVHESGTAKVKFIKTGQAYDEMMEITEGLKAGEEVITVGQQALSDGVKINVAR